MRSGRLWSSAEPQLLQGSSTQSPAGRAAAPTNKLIPSPALYAAQATREPATRGTSLLLLKQMRFSLQLLMLMSITRDCCSKQFLQQLHS